MRTIATVNLSIGSVFAHDLADTRDGGGKRVVLRAGEMVSAELIAELAAAGVTTLGLIRPDVLTGQSGPASEERATDRRMRELERDRSRARAALRSAADGVIAHRTKRWRTLPLRVRIEPSESDRSVAPTPIAELDASAMAIERRDRVSLVRRLLSRLGDGYAVGCGAAIALVEELTHDAIARPDQVASAALASHAPEAGDALTPGALADQAYSAAALCVLSASRMGWSAMDVRSAGLTGLLADAGMMLLPHDVRHATRELTDVEVNALHRHPAYSAALLELIKASRAEDALPECVQLAVFQHHERADGSGYPHRERGAGIHDLALLAGVVDTFLALASPRAHRPALSTHAALREIARLAAVGVLSADHARGLVRAVGVYPPGTRVRLTTGHVAEVVGLAPASEPDRPVVRVLAGRGQQEPGEPINLSWWGKREIAVDAVAA